MTRWPMPFRVWQKYPMSLAAAFLAFAGLVLPFAVLAQTSAIRPIVFDARAQPLRADVFARHFLDQRGSLGIEEVHAVAERGGFEPGPPKKPQMFASPRALWMRLDLDRTPNDGSLFLSTRNTGLDDVSMHWQDASGGWRSVHSGDSRAVDAWPQPARRPLFQLPGFEPSQGVNRQVIYLRVQNRLVPAQVHLYLSNGIGLLQEHRLTYLLLGGYFGLGLVGLLWSASRGLARRQRGYRAYAALMASMLLTQLCVVGVFGQWVLPNSPYAADLLAFVSIVWTAVLGVRFTVVFTQLHQIAPRFYRSVVLFMGFGLALSVLQIVLHSSATFVLSNLYVLASMGVVTAVLFYAHTRGVRHAFWCWLGFTPLILGGLAPLARNAGLLEPSFLTQYSLVIGGAFECVLLFMVLLRRDFELREARIRVEALASTDPATGASDARVFFSRLHHSLLRCAQFKQQCALIRVELSNQAWFAKEHGGDIAQRALVLTAAAMQQLARDVDTVGRMEQNGFALLMEGPVDAASAMKAATQILAKSLAPNDALPIGAQLKLFIAVALLPDGVAAASPDDAGSTQSAHSAWQCLCDQHGEVQRIPSNRVVMVRPSR